MWDLTSVLTTTVTLAGGIITGLHIPITLPWMQKSTTPAPVPFTQTLLVARLSSLIPKGSTMPTIADLQTDITKFQGFIKLAAPVVPGADRAAKAATIDALIDPMVDKWLTSVGADAEIVTVINQIIDWTVQEELMLAGVA